MQMKDINILKEVLSSPKKIAIIPHKNPDGDAIGSTLGLYHYLKGKAHNATVISPNDYPEFLKWMPGEQQIVKFDDQKEKAVKILEEVDLIFTLDFNHLDRIENMKPTLLGVKATFVMIDHHQQPADYAKFMYSDTSMSSTCEMIYHFLSHLDELDNVTPAIANCLYAGIMTDTGSFRFPTTTSKTHRVIASLIDKGAQNAMIHNAIYDSSSLNRLHLLGCALSNLVMLESLNTVFITLTQKELDQHHFRKGDTEGFVNYGLSLKGIIFSVIFIENGQDGLIKISFRSKGDFNVNEFARQHFNGGGHINAAGGRSNSTMEATVSKFKKIVNSYESKLTIA
ncbi:DHH family phosphoesterase [Ascidiimonas sp. W6]|uniref:DHH family phosphoesterase n=1 Tax=Ascidiimonas meishanensis TaxID=3128903 RepID=UPI0030EE5DB9